MPDRSTAHPSPPSRLQMDLAVRILADARTSVPDGPLSELGLAQRLGVSRTPVRAALCWLEGQGAMRRALAGGWTLGPASARGSRLAVEQQVEDTERLFVAIARDRVEGRLDDNATEADLMRRYAVTRPVVLKVLSRLSEVGLVARKRGHGWRFTTAAYDEAARAESYAFRLLVEPAALEAPGFNAPPAWLAQMVERHEAMMRGTWRPTRSIALFDLNADFHEGLAQASGNRHFHKAIQQQNRLRRFVNVHWTEGPDRVQVSCREHLEILSRIQAGEHDMAAALMRRHLQKASHL